MEIRCIDCGNVRKVRYYGKEYLAKYPRCASCGHRIGRNCSYQNELKRCIICKEYLTLDNFSQNRTNWDGLERYCRTCNKIKSYSYYHKYNENAKRIAYKSVALHRDRQNARMLSRYYYPIRRVCEIDGCFELGEKHHGDYSKPLEFRWLCRAHHAELHANAKATLAYMV